MRVFFNGFLIRLLLSFQKRTKLKPDSNTDMYFQKRMILKPTHIWMTYQNTEKTTLIFIIVEMMQVFKSSWVKYMAGTGLWTYKYTSTVVKVYCPGFNLLVWAFICEGADIPKFWFEIFQKFEQNIAKIQKKNKNISWKNIASEGSKMTRKFRSGISNPAIVLVLIILDLEYLQFI